jgi:hypothetical protein
LKRSQQLTSKWTQWVTNVLPKLASAANVTLDPKKPLAGPVQGSSSEDEE